MVQLRGKHPIEFRDAVIQPTGIVEGAAARSLRGVRPIGFATVFKQWFRLAAQAMRDIALSLLSGHPDCLSVAHLYLSQYFP